MTGIFDPESNTWKPSEDAEWHYANLHPLDDECAAGCMIHNPTLDWVGNREGWPYFPRADGRMERVCPHGVGHSDIDSARWMDKHRPHLAAGVHGCDGCCT